MTDQFRVELLPEAVEFIEKLEEKARRKIYYNIRKSQVVINPESFKKLNDHIWEFRTLYNKTYYRLFAFWDKTGDVETLVLATHGLVKKTGKTARIEIDKAERIRIQYFKQKSL
jgi:phage-related protein